MKQHIIVLPQFLRRLVLLCLFFLLSLLLYGGQLLERTGAMSGQEHYSPESVEDCGAGILLALSETKGNRLGLCPLKHTEVKAIVSGFVCRVNVHQQFHNPFGKKIEAVYTFPLPENSAVDQMTMKIGTRLIQGEIKERREAREVYEQAKVAGHAASLLDQERPNIFTQSVANIEPGENVDVEISYVENLHFEKGEYSFVFPTVVGPRFIPDESGKSHETLEKDDDTARISPPVLPKGKRSGQDISISVDIREPFPISGLRSDLHEVEAIRKNPGEFLVKLKPNDNIPNRDFVLQWHVAEDRINSGCLVQRDADGGFFSLMMIPPVKIASKEAVAKELIFLIDCSGSQAGAPIQKAKEAIAYILEHMNPQDSFRILAFNNHVAEFSNDAKPATNVLKKSALSYLRGLVATGGTWMAPAVNKVCSLPNPDHALRIVVFMTDGYVGNDMEILDTVKRFRKDTRWFPFGTGNSVNRFLIESIAREGGGEPEYVLLSSSDQEVGRKFYERISTPVLTDIKLRAEGFEISNVYPNCLSELWAQRPLYFTGRFSKPGAGRFVLTGFAGGQSYRQELPVILPVQECRNDAIKSVWARAKLQDLMSQDWIGVQKGELDSWLKKEIIHTALSFHLMSQFTSFVAVERGSKGAETVPSTIRVPLELPQGAENSALGLRSVYSSGCGKSGHTFGLSKALSFGAKLVAVPGSTLYKQSGEGQNAYYIAGGACQPSFLENDSRTMILAEKGSSFKASDRHVELQSGKIMAFVSKAAVEISTPLGVILIPENAVVMVQVTDGGVVRCYCLKAKAPCSLALNCSDKKVLTFVAGEELSVAKDSLASEELIALDGVNRKTIPSEPVAGLLLARNLFDKIMMIEKEKLLVCNVGSFYLARNAVNKLKNEVSASSERLLLEDPAAKSQEK